MALRLFLVGVVAILALDLPRGGPSRVHENRSWLDARITAPAPKAAVLVADPSASAERPAAIARVEAATVTPPLATVEPTVPTSPSPTIATSLPVMTAPFPADLADLEARLLDLPADVPQPEPVASAEAAPVPMPMPEPAPEIVEIPAPPPAVVVDAAPPEVPVVADVPPPAGVAPAAPEVAPIPAPVAEAPKAEDSDAAFRKVVDALASTFAADLSPAPMPTAGPKPLVAASEVAPPPAAPAEIVAEIPPVESLPTVLAYELNRFAEGLVPLPLPDPTPAPAVAPAAAPVPVPAPALVEETPAARQPVGVEDLAVPSADASPTSSRAERLSQAVRLTGEAVHAWASLLSQGPSSPTTALQR